jgi:hypothetical protein
MCAPRTRRRSRSAATQRKAKRGASRRFEGSAAAAAHARLSRAQVLCGTRGRGRPRGASGGMGRSGRTAQCGATLSTTSRCSCGETNKQTNSAPFARARRTSHAPALSKHAARAQWAPHGSAARPAPLRCWHAHVHTAAAHLRTQRRRFVRLHARTPAHSRAGWDANFPRTVSRGIPRTGVRRLGRSPLRTRTAEARHCLARCGTAPPSCRPACCSADEDRADRRQLGESDELDGRGEPRRGRFALTSAAAEVLRWAAGGGCSGIAAECEAHRSTVRKMQSAWPVWISSAHPRQSIHVRHPSNCSRPLRSPPLPSPLPSPSPSPPPKAHRNTHTRSHKHTHTQRMRAQTHTHTATNPAPLKT